MAVPGYGSTWAKQNELNQTMFTHTAKKIEFQFKNLHCKCKLNSWFPARKRELSICGKRKSVNTCRDEPLCPERLLQLRLCRSRQSGEGNPQGGGLLTFSAAPALVDAETRIMFTLWQRMQDTWQGLRIVRMRPEGVPQSPHGHHYQSFLIQVQATTCPAPKRQSIIAGPGFVSFLVSDRLPLEVKSCAKPRTTAKVHDQISQRLLHLNQV